MTRFKLLARRFMARTAVNPAGNTPLRRAWAAMLIAGYCLNAHGGDLEDGRDAYGRGDFATAIAKYTSAAEAGDQGAQYALGTMYHEGEGVVRDRAQAAYWYRKAAERGNSAAQYWLCIMYREAIGVARDYGEAFYWCRRAAEKGHSEALFAVGQFYFDGLANGFTRDYVRAYIWFSLAEAQGDEDAPMMLEVLEKEMAPLQITEARRRARQWGPGQHSPCSSNNPRARFC